jgi:hypothetical protein
MIWFIIDIFQDTTMPNFYLNHFHQSDLLLLLNPKIFFFFEYDDYKWIS